MATSVTLSSPAAVSAAQPQSFLSLCKEDLSPDKVSCANIWTKVYLVAAGATFVAFTVLAIGSFVVASTLAPAYAPFVAIGALFCAMPVVSWTNSLLEYSKNSGEEEFKYRGIQRHYEDLSKQTPGQIQLDLAQRGINWFQIPGIQATNPEKLTSLNPLLAQARYLDDTIQRHLHTRDTLATEAKDLANADFTANRKKVYELRNAALFAEDRAMEARIHAAFVNAVLRKSDFNGTLENIASLTQIGYQERISGNALNDLSGVSEFLKFNNRNLAPITFHEVKTLSVSQLGQRLVAAMA